MHPLGRALRTLAEGDPHVRGTPVALGPPPCQLLALLPSPVVMVLGQIQPRLDLLAEVLEDGHGRVDAPGLVTGRQVGHVGRHPWVTADGAWAGCPGANRGALSSSVLHVSCKDRQSLGVDPQSSETPHPRPGEPPVSVLIPNSH